LYSRARVVELIYVFI